MEECWKREEAGDEYGLGGIIIACGKSSGRSWSHVFVQERVGSEIVILLSVSVAESSLVSSEDDITAASAGRFFAPTVQDSS